LMLAIAESDASFIWGVIWNHMIKL
jgi:hypothetical protein